MVVSRQRGGLMVLLFTVTIFTSALLLFFVQPLYTRMVLPQIGGAAAVWTTAMLFFQTVLIGGYLYAHLMNRHLPVNLQIVVHIALVLLALTALPLAVPDSWAYDPAQPVVTQTLWLYALGVGLPFAVLSANAPLIQSWYRRSGGPSADDPYFLYAASNLGSLVALLAFPLVAEPLFGVSAISVGWSVGFVILGPMLLLSGLAARGSAMPDLPASPTTLPPTDRITPQQLALWAFLAFLPSSLMLCVTTKISTDLGSFPLVWVIPLALYLLTFVLVFSVKSPLTAGRLQLVLPFALITLIYFTFKPAGTLTGFAAMLVAFFIIALAAHRILFDARPDARHLTVFYLTMSIGGALGGVFNSIVAPIVFDRLTEYPVTVGLCIFLLLAERSRNLPRELAMGLVLSLFLLLPLLDFVPVVRDLTVDQRVIAMLLLLALAYLLLYRQRLVPVMAAISVMGIWGVFGREDAVLYDRSFFGLHIVADDEGLRRYSNGTTIHGAQWLNERGQRPTPLYYYHPNGPLAQALATPRAASAKEIGVIGLGIGAMTCYSRPDQDWHFYEIDQKVVDIARDPDLFDFMAQCGQDVQLHLGDARIVLQGQTDQKYDILVIDAYSSDAIPVHLATLEAAQLYMDRLNDGGLLLFHISNRFYDLSLPLSGLAQELGLEARIWNRGSSDTPFAEGDTASAVVALARSSEALGELATDPRWVPLGAPQIPFWTDDHADLLSALR
ncbi:transporter [Tabrizicola piscis]|uniref:Transporter n=2 Tax=Tabrizicola piscis TaxID=2494374 RepID=A0A3S8UC69_9RHOB|nr:transporter [Tabrizicola piscis]